MFLEPEGWSTNEVYVQGCNTSLPEDVQWDMLRAIPALRHVEIMRVGYAIEYDAVATGEIAPDLGAKRLRGLFLAGQINGTTGYEEAACQGLIAGINAHQKANELDPFILKRSEAYIGVLIDDLISKGTEEPYRMFTSRAEFRTLLRQDNADLRLTELSYKIGLASQERMEKVLHKKNHVEAVAEILKNISIEPAEAETYLSSVNSSPMPQKQKAVQLLMRPSVDIAGLIKHIPAIHDSLRSYTNEVLEQAEIQLKYDVYIQKEKEIVKKMSQLEELEIPDNFNYEKINALSAEALQKFKKVRPRTLGQASRISGVNPSDVQILMVFMGR